MDHTEIIKTDIVNESWDIFWTVPDEMVKDMPAKDTLVLSTTYLSGSPEEAQLQKMLQACKLAPGQYNTVLLKDEQKVAWHQLRDTLKPKTVLLVGILPAQLGISALFHLNEPNHFNGSVFIPTLSIAELEQQPEMKKQLWNNGLKPVFAT